MWYLQNERIISWIAYTTTLSYKLLWTFLLCLPFLDPLSIPRPPFCTISYTQTTGILHTSSHKEFQLPPPATHTTMNPLLEAKLGGERRDETAVISVGGEAGRYKYSTPWDQFGMIGGRRGRWRYVLFGLRLFRSLLDATRGRFDWDSISARLDGSTIKEKTCQLWYFWTKH